MYNLLIVDDEYVEIEALVYVIENSSLPINTIKTANNGRKAISLANSFTPDFVLMDIKMPGISGTEAAAIIKELHPSCKIVFLSAYNYFNYAKEALQLNASDFLIKPVSNKNLIDLLNRLILEIKKELLNDTLSSSINNKFKQLSTFFENEFINYLLFADIKKEQLNEYLSALNCDPSNMHILILAFDDASFINLSSLKETTLKHRSLKILKEYFSQVSINCIGNYNKNYIYMLIVVDSPLSSDSAYQAMYASIQHIRNNFFLDSRVIISKVTHDVMELNPLLLQHKHELLHQRNNDILCFPSITLQKSNGFSNKKEQLLLESIRLNNPSLCLSLAKEYIQWIDEQYLTLSEIKYHLYGLISFLVKSLNNDAHDSFNAFNEITTNFMKKINTITNMPNLYTYFIDQILWILHTFNPLDQQRTLSVIEQLCQYIHAHYQEELTLKYLADEIHMNSQYISKLFKEEKGTTFSDYLTDVRINKSKTLLTKTQQTIQEISLSVGYNDPNYFTRVFKKHEFITPKVYRDKTIRYFNR